MLGGAILSSIVSLGYHHMHELLEVLIGREDACVSTDTPEDPSSRVMNGTSHKIFSPVGKIKGWCTSTVVNIRNVHCRVHA